MGSQNNKNKQKERKKEKKRRTYQRQPVISGFFSPSNGAIMNVSLNVVDGCGSPLPSQPLFVYSSSMVVVFATLTCGRRKRRRKRRTKREKKKRKRNKFHVGAMQVQKKKKKRTQKNVLFLFILTSRIFLITIDTMVSMSSAKGVVINEETDCPHS